MGSSAGTFLSGQHADIAGTVTQQRKGFFCDRSKHQLALTALRQNLARIRIDDLRNKVVFIDMHTGLLAALEGHTGTACLCKTIDIVGLNAQFILNILPHLLTPCLRAEDTCFQLDLILQPSLMNALRQKSGIGRRTAQDRRTQIHHKLQLSVRIAGRHGQCQTAYLMAAAV